MRVLDSNILIYASKSGNEFLDSWMTEQGATVSAISIPEVLGFSALTAADEAIFEAMFARLRIEPVSELVLRRAAALRRQHRLKLGDSIVAATALELGAELVTRNVDDFRHVGGLTSLNPFEVAGPR